jgi:hypothetical protein
MLRVLSLLLLLLLLLLVLPHQVPSSLSAATLCSPLTWCRCAAMSLSFPTPPTPTSCSPTG